MKRYGLVLNALLTLFAAAWYSAAGAQEQFCGSPLLESNAAAYQLSISTANIGNATAQPFFNELSRANVEELKALISPLNSDEEKLTAQMRRMPLYITHRLPLERLQFVLETGALLSPQEGRRRSIKMAEPFTPQLEDKLFGGHSCVFISVGPPEGRDRYGDVLIRVRTDAPYHAWSTLSSGWYFMEKRRESKPQANMAISSDDVLAYSHTFVVKTDWQKFLSLMSVAMLRALPEYKHGEVLKRLYTETDPHKFWQGVDELRLGYLEGKVDASLPLDYTDSIEVPADKLSEVLAWPQSKKWKNKIKAYFR